MNERQVWCAFILHHNERFGGALAPLAVLMAASLRLKRFIATFDKTAALGAYSDEAGHLFRHEAGHRTDLKAAIIPI